MAIVDATFIANELDVTEIRLATLYDHVDSFVIVESPHSIAGNPKQLFFADHRARFAPWADKIVHIVLDDLPLLGEHSPRAWDQRERAMRNGITRGLAQLRLKPDDLVVVSDGDEIAHPDVIREWRPAMGVCAADQVMLHYWLNCLAGGWAGTRLAPYGSVMATSPDYLRRFGASVVANTPLLGKGGHGGWHLTWQGGPDAIRWKLNHYLHQDVNLPHFTDQTWLRCCTGAGLDVLRRDGRYDFIGADDERIPQYARDNREKFAHLFKFGAKFSEYMIGHQQLCALIDTARFRPMVDGLVLDLGCWEGLSTVCLANAVWPEVVVAVDTWAGTIGEGAGHPTVKAAGERDVRAQFVANANALTDGNVWAVQQDHVEYLDGLLAKGQKVRFAHVDGAHDYASVKATLERLLRLATPGATLCGDDLLTADASRADLGGGVERAVRELLPAHERCGNMWIHTKPL